MVPGRLRVREIASVATAAFPFELKIVGHESAVVSRIRLAAGIAVQRDKPALINRVLMILTGPPDASANRPPVTPVNAIIQTKGTALLTSIMLVSFLLLG